MLTEDQKYLRKKNQQTYNYAKFKDHVAQLALGGLAGVIAGIFFILLTCYRKPILGFIDRIANWPR